MKIVKLGALALGMMCAGNLMAQNNMVPNGSFEITEKKIKNGEGEIALATPWISPSETNQADMYATGNKKGYGIPTNDRGYMEPEEGSNYAGFRAFSYRNKLPRTYLQVKLTKPLIAGKKYCVNFKVVLSKTSKYASAHIGMNIAAKKPKQKDLDANAIKPQIVAAGNAIYDNQHEWKQVCGVYIAQGDERYITIGNFVPDGDMVDKRDFVKKRKLKEFPQLQEVEAYYLIDDVSIINLEEIDVCKCEANDAGGNEMEVVYTESTSSGMDMGAADQIALKNVFFNKNNTTPTSAGVIREVIDLLKANPEINIEIVGHMDKVEQKDNLNDLSADRAKWLYDYLVKNGVDASRLSYKGVKSTQPLDEGGTQASLTKNRRVSFVIK
jgi:outer membrane protein OmpA-like peptidoglycan-associated protein